MPMSLKTVAIVVFCLASFASSAVAYTFTLHPHLTATGAPAVDVRIMNLKSTYVAESASVTYTKDRTIARVVYIDRKGNKISVVGQFTDLTKDGARFDIKEWDLPGRDGRPRQ
jgi:hypothetical protein